MEPLPRCCSLASIAGAQDDLAIPDAAKPFVAAGTRPLAFEVADLNRDGRPDAILVLEPTLKPGDDEFAERPRPLLILVGRARRPVPRGRAQRARSSTAPGAAG